MNYSFPPNPKLFVHRVGRTARQGKAGLAVSLVEPDELPFMVLQPWRVNEFLFTSLGFCFFFWKPNNSALSVKFEDCALPACICQVELTFSFLQ